MTTQRFKDYESRKNQELRAFEAKTLDNIELCQKLETRAYDISYLSNFENRRWIWNWESDGNPNKIPRYARDPVHRALNLSAIYLKEQPYENADSLRVSNIARRFAIETADLIKERTINEFTYSSFADLPHEQVGGKLVSEVRKFYDEKLKQLGFIARHTQNGKDIASNYAQQKIVSKYFGERK
jgi:hypothetical protein